MNFRRQVYVSSKWVLLSSFVALSCASTEAQKKSRYACGEVQPETLCNEVNTCGSTSVTCTVSVTRSAYSANVKPSIPNAKNNQLFCVKVGTTVAWMSTNKNNGFMVSFGTDSPFAPDGPIVGGGASAPIVTKASTPGCYKYDVGAFLSGTAYGMGNGGNPEIVIIR
jgi:hypothetical protein